MLRLRRIGVLLVCLLLAAAGGLAADTGPPDQPAIVLNSLDQINVDLNLADVVVEEVESALALGTNAALASRGWRGYAVHADATLMGDTAISTDTAVDARRCTDAATVRTDSSGGYRQVRME